MKPGGGGMVQDIQNIIQEGVKMAKPIVGRSGGGVHIFTLYCYATRVYCASMMEESTYGISVKQSTTHYMRTSYSIRKVFSS